MEIINNLPSENSSNSSFEKNIVNSLVELDGLFGNISNFPTAPLSSTNTLYYNNRWNIISNNRALLSEIYVEHGIIQTLVDQPVDDAFRAGFTIKTEQLKPDQIEQLQVAVEQNRDIDGVMQTLKWSRLYGGGALLIITDQDPMKPLDYKSINEKTLLSFKSADLWELYFGVENLPETLLPSSVPYYEYYGFSINPTRVLPVRGKLPPSWIRPRFRGWGMSECERIVRSMNQYLKNQDLIFELLDEAKVDIYKISGFNATLMAKDGGGKVNKRIQYANLLKNYNNAVVMDINDEYEQKTMSFGGLAEMLQQIRIQIAGDVKMPVTKLFGLSATGFNSGEDDIENYNSMIESEIRSKCKYIVVDVLKLRCQQIFGIIPDDLQIIWNPLRILNAEQEENVKDKKFKRVLDTYNSGLCTDQEAKKAINKGDLLPIKIDENIEAELPFPNEELEIREEL